MQLIWNTHDFSYFVLNLSGTLTVIAIQSFEDTFHLWEQLIHNFIQVVSLIVKFILIPLAYPQQGIKSTCHFGFLIKADVILNLSGKRTPLSREIQFYYIGDSFRQLFTN